MGIIVFYEGNNGTQNIVQTVEDTAGQNFRPVKNDEIRSMKLYGVRRDCQITVFDSPDGAMNDDFAIVNVKKISPEYTVNTFERSYEDDTVVVSFIRNNGLDGKISRIKID
ncbi:hypothetical protein HHL17_22695 [Chitinophaga sp. G-6-1-13]|uniref:Uncharacterized protein n=1 Tax=Chitinophaga fulva TaxID=2728842 RepID=A0A848GWH5_9BACT|nr:hypothetical protein [Chitinophaga fulva]NML40028.1 hypothetical protein [Chitinophaga fulva]